LALTTTAAAAPARLPQSGDEERWRCTAGFPDESGELERLYRTAWLGGDSGELERLYRPAVAPAAVMVYFLWMRLARERMGRSFFLDCW
jgi:hypothetical protein